MPHSKTAQPPPLLHRRHRAKPWLVLGLLITLWLPHSEGSHAASPQESKPPPTAKQRQDRMYPLNRLKLLRYVLGMLQRYYVDPTQFSSKKMFRSALLRLEQKLTSFQVQFTKSAVEVQLGPHKKSFPNGRFLGFFDSWIQLRPIAEFIHKHHKGKMSREDIEYYLTRGAMGTLDKQTLIINPKHYRNRRRRRLVKSGKIGVYLRMKKGKLWITKIVPDGPADQAGLQGGDHIVRVENEATTKGSLWDWSAKIRGLRGTRLALHIQRKGWKKPKRFVLIRAAMPTPNVTGHLLPGKIGYVRLRQFIGGSALAIREQLARLRHQAKGSLLGLILDLRNNGGGLVREAVAICSLFVEKGEVTTYAGANIKRRTYKVTGTNTEERFPMITLINGYSASASELLSGALQSHSRSLIVGRQSYGKGTVQRAGPMGRMGLHVRVTIAQYMLPRSQSIQAAGVTPDIEILPVSLRRNKIRYYSAKPRDQAMRRKRWPKFLLQNLDPKDADKSWTKVYHLLPSGKKSAKKPSKKARRKPSNKSWYMDPTHALGADFDVWFSRYLLVHAKSSRRDIFYSQAKGPLERAKKQEEAKLIKALRKMGLDWRPAPKKAGAQAQLTGKATLIGVKGTLTTGNKFTLQLTVKNTGRATAYRTRAVLYANSKTLRYREFLLGRLRPGQQRSQRLTLTLPAHERSRVDVLKFKMAADGAKAAKPLLMRLPWRSPARPTFALAAHIQDPAPDGNGDGRLQPGERATLFVTLHNKSDATSPNLLLMLRPGRLRVRHKRHGIGVLKGGQARTATFSIHVPDNAKVGDAGLRIALYDRKLKYAVLHRLQLRVAKPLSSLTKAAKGWGSTIKDTWLRAAPTPEGRRIAKAPKGSTFQVLRAWRDYVKVRVPAALFPPNPPKIEPKKPKQPKRPKVSRPSKSKAAKKRKKGTPAGVAVPPKNKRVKAPPLRRKVALAAWVHKRTLRLQATGRPQHKDLQPYFHIQPPSIQLSWANAPNQTNAANTPLSVTIRSTQGIRDVFLLRGKRKVFYKPIQYATPSGLHTFKQKLNCDLKAGVNRIQLTVRTGKSSFHRRFYVTYTPTP